MIQNILHWYYSRERRNFEKRKGDIEGLQRDAFARLTKNFKKCGYTPVWNSKYESIPAGLDGQTIERAQERLARIWKAQPKVTWEPTSGTSGGRKWIPYTKEFRHDLNRAAALWLADAAGEAPGILKGSHYWSLSWLPQELREKNASNDDTHMLPAWQRWMFRQIMATPNGLQNLPTAEETWFATLVYLAHREDLSLISIWSPTFALRLCDDLWRRLDEIRFLGPKFLADRGLEPARERREWPRRQGLTAQEDSRFFAALWPRLSLISSWDSATSAGWAEDIRSIFPGVRFQGKGLWATEGPVTIPYSGFKVLSAHSHFFEFRCLETDRILPAWKLERDQYVQPLLWSSNGFFRYPLADRLKVSGFYSSIPCLEFEGRLASTDLVGEKMENSFIGDLLHDLRRHRPDSRWGGVFAVRDQRRYVLALIGSDADLDLDRRFEAGLLRNHHYRVARELGQLQPAVVWRMSSIEGLENRLMKADAVKGQMKVENLHLLEKWDLT